MVAVGLKATLRTMFSPLEMPPWTPPDLQEEEELFTLLPLACHTARCSLTSVTTATLHMLSGSSNQDLLSETDTVTDA